MFKLPGKKAEQTPHDGVQDMGITSLIARGVTVRGGIELKAGIKIHGRVLGDVKITEGKGVVLVHSEAEILGSILADRVFLAGTVNGDIKAREVYLYGTAKVTGEINYSQIVIHEGACVNGYVQQSNTDKSLVAKARPEAQILDAN